MSPLETNKQAETPGKPAAGDAPSAQQQVIKLTRAPATDQQLTTLFGSSGYGQYRVRPENFLLSVITHTAILAAMLWLYHVTIAPTLAQPKNTASVELAPYIPLQVGKNGPSGGGGGDASKLKASAGTPPRAAKQQFAPPVVLQQQKSKLMVEPTVVADLKVTPGQIGDPLSKLMTPSNGTGIGGGIGSGDGGGVGSGHGGPGVGPGIFHIGNGVSAPRAIYTPEPEFSEEARKSKYQGVVVLEIVVGADGRVRDPRVIRSLGMGLDEKAKEAVRNWKFDPAKMNGRPVAVEMAVEVSFNLY